MPNDASNFTTPDAANPNRGYETPGPAGGGDQGQVWNPTGGPNGTGAWEPRPMVPGGVPMGPNNRGFSNVQEGKGAGQKMGGQHTDGAGNGLGGASLGKVAPASGAGAWGGYSGTMVPDGKGGVVYDPSQSGRAADVGRARSLGEAAANRGAYQIDYSQADNFAGMGQQARGGQDDAMFLAQNAAMGNGSQARDLGRSMLRQGAQSQQAAALSTRGGPLAQAAAMRQQQAGAGAFMQQGERQMEALRADEMAAGRQQYMGMAGQQRSQDATAQGLNQQQGIQQMGQELGQRELNQQGQMGYEAQGQAINHAAADAALKAREIQTGIDAAAALRGQQQAQRDAQKTAAIVGGVGTVAAGAAGALGKSGGGSPSPTPEAPKQTQSDLDDIDLSDVRGKTNITSLASAAMARRGYR